MKDESVKITIRLAADIYKVSDYNSGNRLMSVSRIIL
jgi:hypothetical protein